MNNNNSKKVAVAMSGGVDSSVTAYILKESGYDVLGVNLKLWSCFKNSKKQSCCSNEDRRDAEKVCSKIGIPYISIDMRDEFKDKIVLEFVKEYLKGKTPNPCIRCNRIIKFDALMAYIKKEFGIETLATGHYARIKRDSNGEHLLKGLDPTKDQSYFLFDIKPALLKNIYFPIGKYQKAEIREIASKIELDVAEKKDSQEICFVPDGDIASFIEDFYPEHVGKRGDFVDENGNVLGHHRGHHAYTIGQRRGLGIGFGERKYVISINSTTGDVLLGDNQNLFKKELRVEHLNMFEHMGNVFTAEVKVRYRSDPVSARVVLDDKNGANIRFKEPVRAITPGQAAVFYDGDLVIGGGWII